MSQRLQDGRWFTVATKEQHDCLKQYGTLTRPGTPWSARVQIGTWVGPGRYLLLQYRTRRDDEVNNVCTAAEVIDAAREEMRELAAVLREARRAIG